MCFGNTLCVCVCLQVHYGGSQRSGLPQILSTSFSEMQSLTELEPTNSARLTEPEVPEILLSPRP